MRNISKDIIAACLLDSENLAMTIERGVTPAWFEFDGVVYKALVDLYERQKWDKRSAINVIEAAGIFTKFPVVEELWADPPEWAYKVEEMGNALEVLAGEHAKRSLNSVISTAQHRLLGGDDPFEVGMTVSEGVEQMSGISTIAEETPAIIADQAYEIDEMISRGEVIGLPFPWKSFQELTFGLPPKSVIPLMGRDGVCKTRLAMFLAEYWGSIDIPILYVAIEDGKHRFMTAMAATNGGYDTFTLRSKYMPPTFMGRHREALSRVADMPVYVEDTPCTADRLVSLIATYKRKYGIRGVVVDGLKDIILSGDGGTTSQENRRDQAINGAAKVYDVSIVTISHINKIDEDVWISRRNVTGSDNQNKSARFVLILQDKGFIEKVVSTYNISGNELVLQAAKTSYGNTGIVVLDPQLERGKFVEVPKGGLYS